MPTGSTPLPDSRTAARMRRDLMAWYDRERRDLPWRGVGDPYAVLVSEFMLQQTRVAAVLPYYDAFLRKFPTMDALAAAVEEDVRAAWSGLGYYRRARNLQATARILVAEHAGSLPRTLAELRALPGVGDYTAAALGSIVHELPAAVVDGNVIRVLARTFAIADPVGRSETRARLAALADRLLDRNRPGDANQAMMELGAVVCLPRAPRCDACPWAGRCRARAEGDPERYPAKRGKPKAEQVTRVLAVIRRGHAVLLVRRRDPRLLDGTWEFPGVDLAAEEPPERGIERAMESLGHGAARVGSELVRVKHAITNRRITVRAFAVRPAAAPRARRGEREWVDAGALAGYPISSMTAKVFRGLAPLLTTS